MSGEREKVQRYITDTFNYIHTVREFCSNFPLWKNMRETEIVHMMDFKEEDDKVCIIMANYAHADLQKELDEVLNNTMEGLNELHIFLDAVEKLAVTSLYVFMENQVLHLPENIDPNDVQAVIIAAQQICPLLLVFKRDPEVFFKPKFQNVEVLVYMLEKYLETTEKICDKLDTSFFSDMDLKMAAKTSAEFDEALCENDKQKMVDHIRQLDEIRMDEDFRMVFLFQDVSYNGLINEFNERQARMMESLDELDEYAVQLDRMCKGAHPCSSWRAAVGGLLSSVDLALFPFTEGVYFGLTKTDFGLEVNSFFATSAKRSVTMTNKRKANTIFQNFMEDIQSIQDCLEEVTNQPAANMKQSMTSMAVGVGGVAATGVDAMVDSANALKSLQTERVAGRASSVVAQEGKTICNVPRQAAAKGSLFLGMDIVKDSVGLAKGSKTKLSKFIRARAELWRSEINSWNRICLSLKEGLKTATANEAVLEMQFYLDTVMENLEDVEEEIYFDAVDEQQKNKWMCVIF